MRKISAVWAGGLTLACCMTTVPMRAGAQVPMAPAAADSGQASVAARSKTLSKLFADIWEDQLKHSPELASTLGDKRYDDQLTDYSVKEVNAALERGRGFIQQLSEIDTTGLPDQEKLSAELMLRSLIDDQEAAKFKEWEMPINQFSGIHTELPRLVNQLQFDSVKDYDNYIARLKKVPTAFSQIMTNIQLGIDKGRVPPAYLLEKMLAQIQTLADQKPEESPFAAPLKKFPASVSATEQKRISTELLAVIGTDVLPSYKRLAGFVKVDYVPAGRKDPGAWSLPDGDAYYAFKVQRSTTLNKTPERFTRSGWTR